MILKVLEADEEEDGDDNLPLQYEGEVEGMS